MDTITAQSTCKKRVLKLSLKKNKLKLDKDVKKLNASPDIIILDDTFDRLKSDLIKCEERAPKIFSPIIINDSCDISDTALPRISLSSDNTTPSLKEPSRTGNVSFNSSHKDNSFVETNQNRPSIGGIWSPAQKIICATPKYLTTPSTPKDLANESSEECTMKKIQLSQRKLLDDLYGEVWKSIPSLFKTVPRKHSNNFNEITKKLDFDDDESDKENLKTNLVDNRNLYLTRSDIKSKVRFDNDDVERRSKKKLYTEKIPNTPEPKQVPKKREAKSTGKKIRGKTVTEMVQNMGDIAKDFKKITIAKRVENLNRLSFMESLADNIPTWRCNIEALTYKDDYITKREDLTRRLFVDFNKIVFENGLEDDMMVTWDTKLRSTAGITRNRLVKNSKGEKLRSSSINLSTKVVDRPQRLRNTLIHEMCHAATWVIDHEMRAAHGPLWKKWATKALRAIPELGEISRCHDMTIHFKYEYKCTKCGYSIQRHSKSIDTTKKCCGYCRGTFQLILNKKTKDGGIVSTPARQGKVNDFALYVKENYSLVKNGNRTHAEVMKLLGEQFSNKKGTKQNGS